MVEVSFSGSYHVKVHLITGERGISNNIYIYIYNKHTHNQHICSTTVLGKIN